MKQAGFQTRLLLTYSLFIAILTASFSAVYFVIRISETDKRVFEDLRYRVERMSDQLDTVLTTMDYATTDTLSLAEFIPSMTTLAYFDREDEQYKPDILNALKYIEGSIYRYSLIRDFYRVAVYTPALDFYSNNFLSYPVKSDVKKWVSDNPRLERCRELSGRMYFMPKYQDPWDTKNNTDVFGIIRAVVDFQEGNTTGYIEIQNSYSVIERMFDASDELEIHTIVTTPDGDTLYKSAETSSNARRIIFREPYRTSIVSQYTGIRIELSRDRWNGLSSTANTIWIFFTVSMAVLAVSLLAVRFFTLQLTHPIRQLKNHVDRIELGSSPSSANLESPHDEIEALDFALTHLQNRLNEALRRER